MPISTPKPIVSGLILTSALLAIQSQALAATNDNTPSNITNNRGYYIQGGFGTFAMTSEGSVDVDSFSGHLGGIAIVGYQFNQHFGVEFDTVYGSYEYDDVSESPTKHYSLDGGLAGPAVKGTLPMGDHWRLNGKLGFALYWESGHYTEEGSSEQTDYSKNVGLPFDAIGVSYVINDHITLGLEYTGLLYLAANTGLASFNMAYHFSS